VTTRYEANGRNGLANWNGHLVIQNGRLHVHLCPDPLEPALIFIGASIDHLSDAPDREHPVVRFGPGRLIARYVLNFEERSPTPDDPARTPVRLQAQFEIRVLPERRRSVRPEPVHNTGPSEPASPEITAAWLTGDLRRDETGHTRQNYVHDVFSINRDGPYREHGEDFAHHHPRASA